MGAIKTNAVWSDAGKIPADGSQTLSALESDVEDNWTIESIGAADFAAGASPMQIASNSSGLSTGEGKAWYDTTNNTWYIHNGTGWIHAGQGLNAKLFGATGDGATDDRAAIVAAIDAAATLGLRVVYLPGGPGGVGGTYVLDSHPAESGTVALPVNDPIYLVGDGWGSDDTTYDPTLGQQTKIIAGTSFGTVTMIHFVSATASNWLTGCGCIGMTIDLQNRAKVGIHADGVAFGLFRDLRMLRGTGLVGSDEWHMQFDGANGAPCFGNVIDTVVIDVAGTAGCILLDGESAGSGTGCSRNVLRNLTLGHENGDAIQFNGNVDNNTVEHVEIELTGGGSGFGLHFKNGASSHARNSTARDFSGTVKARSTTFGNRVYMTSEGGSVSIDAGAQLYYEVTDHLLGALYKTDAFKMRDRLWLPASSFQPGSSGTPPTRADYELGDSIVFAAGVTDECHASVPGPYEWGEGNITSAIVHWGTTGSVAAEAWVARVEIATVGDDQTPSDENTAADETITLPATPNNRAHRDAVTVTSVDFSEADFLQVRVSRIGGDAADTAAGVINFLGIELIFQGSGPISGGHDWSIPVRSN